MKLVEASETTFVFEFSHREKELLAAILKYYPLLNPDYHRLPKPTGDRKIDEGQDLLIEAMAEQKAANKKLVTAFFAEENWPPAGIQLRRSLSSEEMGWLLQVLNDVRVGSWVKLGRPDHQHGKMPEMTIENLPYVSAMELAGLFQSILLEALKR